MALVYPEANSKEIETIFMLFFYSLTYPIVPFVYVFLVDCLYAVVYYVIAYIAMYKKSFQWFNSFTIIALIGLFD